MRILVIGGTGFIGPEVVRRLVAANHEVTLFHRGKTTDKRVAGAREIFGSRQDLASFASTFRSLRPDVALDMICYNLNDAEGFVEAMSGVARRAVVLSSIDVYLAYGRLHGTEPGAPQPVPITETAELRSTDQPAGPQRDKRTVERTVLAAPRLPATILRLPAVYGYGDPMHRIFNYLKPMDDDRPALLLSESLASWRWTHGAVENVAAAIVLALEDERAAGEIYNVGDADAPEEREWVRRVGRAAGWSGDIVVVPDERCPPHLRVDAWLEQDWVVDTSKIRRDLGYREVVSHHEALQRAVTWERTHPPTHSDPRDFDYEVEDALLKTAW